MQGGDELVRCSAVRSGRHHSRKALMDVLIVASVVRKPRDCHMLHMHRQVLLMAEYFITAVFGVEQGRGALCPYILLHPLGHVQPFSQKSRTPTVAKEFQIGLCGVVEADLELRGLRGRRGRFGTLLQQLECGIFGRTAVCMESHVHIIATMGNCAVCRCGGHPNITLLSVGTHALLGHSA